MELQVPNSNQNPTFVEISEDFKVQAMLHNNQVSLVQVSQLISFQVRLVWNFRWRPSIHSPIECLQVTSYDRKSAVIIYISTFSWLSYLIISLLSSVSVWQTVIGWTVNSGMWNLSFY